MSFILIFVLVCIVFPLSVEVFKKGNDNILVRSTNQAKVLVTETIEMIFSYVGGKGKKISRPITRPLTSFFSSFSKSVRMVIGVIIGLFILYIVLEFVMWLFGMLFISISWLFA